MTVAARTADTIYPPAKCAPKKVPLSGTRTALRFLEAYLDDKPNRKKATVDLLGCGLRTATRLTSRKTPYRGRLKLVWAIRICAAVGKPMDDILGTVATKTYAQTLVGWNHSTPGSQALQDAGDCGLAIVNRALVGFGLSGSYQVTHTSGRPTEVNVILSPQPDLAVLGPDFKPHRLVIREGMDTGALNAPAMQIVHVCPHRGNQGEQRLTVSHLEFLLHTIYERTKNCTIGLQRESARGR